MDGNTWRASCDQLITDHQVGNEIVREGIIKHVGPIWGQYEAAEKVNKYMTENNMHEQQWVWTGSWNSECGTSYARFDRTYPADLL